MATRKYHRKSNKFRKTRSKRGGVTTRSGTNTSKAIKVSKTTKQTKPKIAWPSPSPSPEKEPIDDCPICTEPMDNINDLVTTKPCKHTFHQDCLRGWCQSQTNTKCPLCRTLIPDTCQELGVHAPVAVPNSDAELDINMIAERDRIVARIRNGDSSNLEGADLRGANLDDVNLTGADLRGANLQGASLDDADLTGVDLRGANLEDASLRGADLEDANLQGANLHWTDFEDAILVYGTIFGNNTGEHTMGLPYYINLSGGKRKTRKSKRKSKRKTKRKSKREIKRIQKKSKKTKKIKK